MSVETQDVEKAFEGLLQSEMPDEQVQASDEQSEQAEQEVAETEEVEEQEAQADDAETSEVDAEEYEEADVSEDEPSQPGTVSFTDADGQVITLTAEEAKASYMRQSDYTKKSQANARFSEELQKAYADFTKYKAEQLEKIKALMPAEPDWKQRFEDDPDTANYEYIQYQEKKKEREQLEAQTQQEIQQQMDRHMQQQRVRITELLPEWRDADVAQRENAEATSFLINEMGLTQDDVSAISDARLVHIAVLASRQHKLQKGTGTVKAKKVQARNKVLKPGSTAKKKNPRNDFQKKLDRVQQTQKREDIASAFDEVF